MPDGNGYVVLVGGGSAADVPGRLLASYADTADGHPRRPGRGARVETAARAVGRPGRVRRPGAAVRARLVVPRGAARAGRWPTRSGSRRRSTRTTYSLLRAVHELPDLGDGFVEQCFGHLDEARLERPRGRRCAPGSRPRAAPTRPPRRCSCTATRCATGCARSPSPPGSAWTDPRTPSRSGGRCAASTSSSTRSRPTRRHAGTTHPTTTPGRIDRGADHTVCETSIRSKGQT